jgi:deoxyribodipyrimidine photolyase-related protein
MNLRFIFGDQLSHNLDIVKNASASDIFLFSENSAQAKNISHHPKKIALIFSAMRHFAKELEEKGFKIDYIKFDDSQNKNSFTQELKRAIKTHNPSKIIICEPSEIAVFNEVKSWKNLLKLPLEIQFDNRFLCSHAFFRKWSANRKELRLEFFYREMRKMHKILIDEKNKPIGGAWNFDAENRQALPKNIKIPKRISHKKDEITSEVLELVEKNFSENFGDLNPFHFAVNRVQALIEANHFIEKILPNFGAYQDAMATNEAYLFHSLLSCYLNIGLLEPLEICQMAQKSYEEGKSSLPSVEGFIRQILGWREYVRGIYWLYEGRYEEMNFFNAKNKMPALFWGAKTQMHCLSEVVNQTKIHAYSHHIQRLMITGNFALLTALNPKEVHRWYLEVYADAFEWVELPNTLGMALHADGGIMASKPYAASGKYVARMSNFCKSCKFNPEETLGEGACPLNSLYWNFLYQNQDKLKNNMRLKFAFSNLEKMPKAKLEATLEKAGEILNQISANKL